MKKTILLFFLLAIVCQVSGQHSVARQWNEVLLDGIRRDFARPTVHARNLFHVSAAMYDAWAVFSEEATPYLLGRRVQGFSSRFIGFEATLGTTQELQETAISYAAYRLILHRFAQSPRFEEIKQIADQLLVTELGYDAGFVETDYSTGSAASLGNYIATQYIAYGLVDGSNEINGYANQFYEPVNDFLNTQQPGNPNISDPNHWQPLAFDVFIDQGGNPSPNSVPEFVGAEWGWVKPFSLSEEVLEIKRRNGSDFPVYHDPGPPPYLDPVRGGASSDLYKWTFSLVAIWSGHLDAALDKEIDISPASLGNFDIDDLPVDFKDYDQFYKYLEGGDISTGYSSNPVNGAPYSPQLVRLGDYGRILAEFWADGPDSETPPGHWFTILNYVNDHPLTEKRLEGNGEELDPLEWDIKSYFALGGAMHDVAITAWSIKGFYDYIRPVSAIRYMADRGQSSDPSLPRYHIAGIPLVDGHIELVTAGDPLAGSNNEHLNKIKLWAWKGPAYIENPNSDVAGVGWILAENWWPYQRPSFITPPFAGYISGHSTFSRAAAEVLTRITGSSYFPGGMGIFDANKNEFLVFEEGPSVNIELQWASYRDASDQCSLSRIWGGIHPPADDLNGRRIGEKIGNGAFDFANAYFKGEVGDEVGIGDWPDFFVYPNPYADWLVIICPDNQPSDLELFDISGKLLWTQSGVSGLFEPELPDLNSGTYILRIQNGGNRHAQLIIKR